MQPTSTTQFEACAAGRLAPPERVRDDVIALAQRMPDQLPFSLCYLLLAADGSIVVIDPGTDDDTNLSAIADAAASAGRGIDDVALIVATHLHPDHLGLAARLRAVTRAPIALHAAEQRALDTGVRRLPTPEELAARLEAWGVPAGRRGEFASAPSAPLTSGLAADRLLAGGDRIVAPGFDLEVVHTPGHTAGHLCLRDDARDLLFTGDHVLPNVFSGIGLSAGMADPLGDDLASLDRVLAWPDAEVLPGHGWRFMGLADRVAEQREHHLARTREVAAVLASEPDATVWRIASQLTWTLGWDGLHGFLLYSALQQTEMHRAHLATAAE